MIIDFNNIAESVMPHFKGGEGDTVSRIYFDGLNNRRPPVEASSEWSMRHSSMNRLGVGCTIGYHKHVGSSEVILITSGVARCLYDDGEEMLTVDQVHYCPRGHSHSLINASTTEPLEYFAIVPEQLENA